MPNINSVMFLSLHCLFVNLYAKSTGVDPLDISLRQSFMTYVLVDILAAAWWGNKAQPLCCWKPLRVRLKRAAAVMAYIMEFMAFGGLLP